MSPVLPLAFFFQAEDGIRDLTVTGVQTCALPIYCWGLLKSQIRFSRSVRPLFSKPIHHQEDVQEYPLKRPFGRCRSIHINSETLVRSRGNVLTLFLLDPARLPKYQLPCPPSPFSLNTQRRRRCRNQRLRRVSLIDVDRQAFRCNIKDNF